MPQLCDVNTDQQDKGLEATVIIDRDTAARLGVAAADIDIMHVIDWGAHCGSKRFRPGGARRLRCYCRAKRLPRGVERRARSGSSCATALGRAFKLLAVGSTEGLLLGILASRVLAYIVYQANVPRSTGVSWCCSGNGAAGVIGYMDSSTVRALG